MSSRSSSVFKILVLLITISILSLGCQNSVVDATQPIATTTTEANTTEAQTEPEPEPVIPNIQAFATVYPVYELARMIGEGAADVEIVVPPGADAHDFEPSAKLVGAIEASTILFYNGLGLEHWLENLLGAIRADFVSVMTSSGVETLPIDAAISLDDGHHHNHDDEEDAHHHGSEDPHVWLDPQRAMIMAQNILDGYVLVDPDREAIYRKNYEAVVERLELLDRDFEEALINVEKRDIVVGHAAYGYLTSRYNLKQYAIAGISPLEEPSAAQLRKITNIIRKNQITVIFYDVLANPKFSEVLAQETGTITAVLNPLEGITADQGAQGVDFFTLMYQNLEALKKALIVE